MVFTIADQILRGEHLTVDSEVTTESKCMHWKGIYRSFNPGILCKNPLNYQHFLAIHPCLKTTSNRDLLQFQAVYSPT